MTRQNRKSDYKWKPEREQLKNAKDTKRNKKIPVKPQINTKLENLTDEFIGDLVSEWDSTTKLRVIRDMLILDNATSLAYDSLSTLIASMIKEYNNDDELIQEEVRANLEKMDGTLTEKILEACTMFPYGFSLAVPLHGFNESGSAVIRSLNFLRQDLVEFDEEIPTQIVTYDGKEEVKINYGVCIHFKNQANITPGHNPRGHRLGDRALRYWDLDKILLASYAIVAQKQATKLLVGYTDTTDKIETGKFDAGGNAITEYASSMMLEALKKAGNSSVLVADREDRVEAVDQANDGEFFMKGFSFAEEQRFRAFYHSSLIYTTSQSGLGDSSLAEFQLQNLMSVIHSKALYITGQIVEKLIKTLIIFNHGEQDNYGNFTVDLQDSKALEIGSLIVSMLDKQAYIEDPENKKAAIERLSGLVGIGG